MPIKSNHSKFILEGKPQRELTVLEYDGTLRSDSADVLGLKIHELARQGC